MSKKQKIILGSISIVLASVLIWGSYSGGDFQGKARNIKVKTAPTQTEPTSYGWKLVNTKQPANTAGDISGADSFFGCDDGDIIGDIQTQVRNVAGKPQIEGLKIACIPGLQNGVTIGALADNASHKTLTWEETVRDAGPFQLSKGKIITNIQGPTTTTGIKFFKFLEISEWNMDENSDQLEYKVYSNDFLGIRDADTNLPIDPATWNGIDNQTRCDTLLPSDNNSNPFTNVKVVDGLKIWKTVRGNKRIITGIQAYCSEFQRMAK